MEEKKDSTDTHHDDTNTSANTSANTYTTTGTTASNRGKPNKCLTKHEKEEKRQLKKKLKTLQKIKKFETRIKHAMSRNDPRVEKQTRKELEKFIMNSKSAFVSTSTRRGNDDEHDEDIHYNEDRFSLQDYECAKTTILGIANKLFVSFSTSIIEEEQQHVAVQVNATANTDDDNRTGTSNNTTAVATPTSETNNHSKEYQTNCAVTLLKNMTKGTVNKTMFDNKAALLGYTRQKFYQRAMLLYTSLDKLRPSKCRSNSTNKSNTDNQLIQEQGQNALVSLRLSCHQEQIRSKMWKQIQNGHIRNSCSIGCGPANDCVGLLTFLYHLHHPANNLNDEHCNNDNDIKTSSGLDRMLMMDWSIQQWNDAILKPLTTVLKETPLIQQHQQKQCHESNDIFYTYFCDVTRPYTNEDNDQARIAIDIAQCDIFLISYVLSETNDKWDSFFNGLIQAAKEGSLFYFAEPTPWQLHRLIDHFSALLDFLWVDSSMYYPSLQSLDGRLGPAVLFAIKK